MVHIGKYRTWDFANDITSKLCSHVGINIFYIIKPIADFFSPVIN